MTPAITLAIFLTALAGFVIAQAKSRREERNDRDRERQLINTADTLYKMIPRLEALQSMYIGTYRLMLRKKREGESYDEQLTDCVLLHKLINAEIQHEADLYSAFETESHPTH